MNIPPPPEIDNLTVKDLRNWCEDLYRYLQRPSFHNGYLGTVNKGNYAKWNAEGQITFYGTAGIEMTMKVPVAITLDDGSSTDVIADLQTMHDGNVYHIDEAAGAGAIDLQCTFTSVEKIAYVFIQAYYEGSATHAVSIQLYNYTTTNWDTIGSVMHGVTMENFHVPIPDDADYISSGGWAIVRFNHTMNGNGSHDLYIDYVALVN